MLKRLPIGVGLRKNHIFSWIGEQWNGKCKIRYPAMKCSNTISYMTWWIHSLFDKNDKGKNCKNPFQDGTLYKIKIRNFQNLQLLCLAHIKIYDRAIKIWSVGRPIYQVWLSQIGRWRAFTLKICTADHSWGLFCFASVDHRPFIARQSDDSRAIIGRWSDDRSLTNTYTMYVHAYYIIM